MDRLFRQSGLYREKWDRPQTGSTYGWITVEKAAAETQNVYRPSQKKSKTAAPGKKFAGRGGVSLWDLQPENNPRYPWADLGSGRIFADYFKSIARFVKERKTWYVYTGKVWEADTAVVEIMKLGKYMADDIMNYAMALPDERVRTAYMEYAKRWQKLNFRQNAIKEAESEYPIQMKEFDEKTFAFNCRNGTLHLNTMEFKKHDSADFLTKMADVRYDPKARCERWEQFISEIIPNDLATADFLQRALGYSLTGETQHECMFILWGRKTRNGKGTLCESIMRIMGDYGRAVSPETLAQKPNLMNITVINGTEQHGCTFAMKEQFLAAMGAGHSITEYFLPRDCPAFCTGCKACFFKDISVCPHRAHTVPICGAHSAQSRP
ncbi:MAG: hypothetical protein FWC27_08680 [Firmicutes bacterium]|nr:hypothetical protein [Bacillota bacterium]